MSRTTTISVIIPTLNEAERIASLVESLLQQSLQPLEVIVVDGESEDQTAALAKQAGATVLNTRPNVAGQRNFGAHAAIGEYLFFMDADVTVPIDFVRRSFTQIKKRKLAIACPRYWPYNSNILIKALHAGYNFTFWALQKLTPCGGGSCIMVSRQVFERTPGFRENYTFEDMKFLADACRHGRFGIISTTIGVSDRRFKQDGTLKTALLYGLISPFLLLRWYTPTQMIKYKYDHYH